MRWGFVVMGVVVLAGCEERRMTLTLEVTEDVQVSSAARANWMLFGQDENAADVSGSTVADGTAAVDGFPIDLEIKVPRDPNERIDHGWGPPAPEDAMYWFSVDVDLDGDGSICPGDLFEDYDARDIQFFHGEIPRHVTIAMHEIPEDWPVNPCRD